MKIKINGEMRECTRLYNEIIEKGDYFYSGGSVTSSFVGTSSTVNPFAIYRPIKPIKKAKIVAPSEKRVSLSYYSGDVEFNVYPTESMTKTLSPREPRKIKLAKIQKITKLIPHKFSSVKPVKAWGFVKDGKLQTLAFPDKAYGENFRKDDEKIVRVLVSVV